MSSFIPCSGLTGLRTFACVFCRGPSRYRWVRSPNRNDCDFLKQGNSFHLRHRQQLASRFHDYHRRKTRLMGCRQNHRHPWARCIHRVRDHCGARDCSKIAAGELALLSPGWPHRSSDSYAYCSCCIGRAVGAWPLPTPSFRVIYVR